MLICDRCRNPMTESVTKIVKRNITVGTTISAGSAMANPITRPDMDQTPDLCENCYFLIKDGIKEAYEKLLNNKE